MTALRFDVVILVLLSVSVLVALGLTARVITMLLVLLLIVIRALIVPCVGSSISRILAAFFP